MPYFTYVLRSEKDAKLYIGSTKDVERRFEAHNRGKSKSTRSRRPLRLVYWEEFSSRPDAAKREWYFKNTAEGNIWLKERLKNLGC